MFQLANYLFYLLQRSFAEDNVHSLKKLKLCEFSYTYLLSSTEPNPLFSFKTTVKSKNLSNQLQLETKHYEIYHDEISGFFTKIEFTDFKYKFKLSGFFEQCFQAL